jgi:hypothetical protein
MKIKAAIIFFLTLTTVCYGQVTDDFSDGDFTSKPTWSGSSPNFIVNASKQLQLNNSVAGTSYLSTPFVTATLADFEWQAYVKLGFAASGSNFARIYLVSDQADLSQPLHGFYLQFGEAGSKDAIELFRQNGTTSTSVCRGTNGAIASAFAVRIKVTRDKNGNWQLNTDYSGGTNFVLEASGNDISSIDCRFLGIFCIYTVSNATKFFFDDLYAGPSLTDKTPPTVVNVSTLSADSVSVLFSETVDASSAQNVSNYTADNSVGTPQTAALQPDGKTVILKFTKQFTNGVQNQLAISGVADVKGNVMAAASFSFLYFKAVAAQPTDIIITEIFPDPSPQVGLPAEEYVEIFNRSINPFDLAGWKFSDGTSTTTFGSQIILPNQYWIVCASANAALFTTYGNVIGVSNFPTLNNGGDDLTLRDASAKTIDSVNYTLDWYHDQDKQEGGWSLEIIDPNSVCGEEDNWAVSEDPSGGTPGKQNSIFANKPDLTGPLLLTVTPLSSTILKLAFNEKLESDMSAVVFSLTPSVTISKKYFADRALRVVMLELSDALAVREFYTLQVSNLTDCSGNFIQQDFSTLSFVLPEAADSLDVVINEILFNPRSGGVDFVEIYNRSEKYINLKNWKLGNYQNGATTNGQTIFSDDFILAPLRYQVFTSNPSIVESHYPQSVSKNLFKMTMPSFPDDEGTVALQNDQSLTIDHFSYSQHLHSSFLKNKEGVSLERISFSAPTQESSNWRSASATSGFATPGFLNSNARPDSFSSENTVTVDPEIFSPSESGRNFSKINYTFVEGGWVAKVKILDSQGRLIKTIANNETLSLEGFYRWDGDRDDGSQARVGYYVVWFEVFDSSGSVNVFRKRVIIGK